MSRSGRTHDREAGFGLVEIIVVVVIMAALAGMVVRSTSGSPALAHQQAQATIAAEVLKAAVAFESEFPRIGATDPLINFPQRNAIRQRLNVTGAALPAAESAEADLGFFTRTGRPYFTKQLESPYGGRITLVRGTCPTTATVAAIYVCRPSGRPNGVRVTAWARSRNGTFVRVFDSVGGA